MYFPKLIDFKQFTKTNFFPSLLIVLMFLSFSANIEAQYKFVLTHEDSTALENVIVEKYYTATASDCADTSFGKLKEGSVTYRIYIDMKPGYTLQMVYGDKFHDLVIQTSTYFFNNTYLESITGYNVNTKDINKNTVALDSWITMGAASKVHTGILLAEDKDGSVLTRPEFAKADGLTNGIFPTLKAFNLDLNFFKDKKDAKIFSANNGAWAALGGGGVKGPTESNCVLIAQLTTDGTLSFHLNVQIGTPLHAWVKFVSQNPGSGEIANKSLAY
jgi:hypothetical protein